MKQKISILAVLLLVLCVNTVTAQLYEASLDQKLQNSTLIIEGKVIKSEAFRGNNGHIYTAHDIQVFSILKGDLQDLQNQKATVITYSGTLDDENETWTHLLTLSKNEVGIFFLTATNRPIPDENKAFYEVYSSSQGFLKYTENDFQEVVAIAPFNYHQKNDLLQNIRQSTGQFTPVFTDDDGSPEDVTGVEYSIKNVSLSGNVLDFDIYVEGLWGSYDLTESELLIEYDPTVLGQNIQSNGVLSISPGIVSNSPNYSLSVNDINPDRVSINVKALNTGFALYTVSNVAEQLVHVQIASPASGNPDIEFDEAAMQQLSEYLDANNSVEAFQQVFAVGKIEDISGGNVLAPNISSFYPNTISAGTNDTLTIIGSNFGLTRDTSIVEFTDSEAGPNPVKWVTPYKGEYIDWSNDTIKVIVPSFVTTGDIRNSAGTGFFRVNMGSNGIATSPTSITVPFAAYNWLSGQFATPAQKGLKVTLNNYNGDGGQYIYYANNFKVDTGAVQAFERALIKWKCSTFVNYKIKDSIDIVDFSNVGRVEFDSLPIFVIGTTVAVTLASVNNLPFQPCGNSNGSLQASRVQFRVKFNSVLNWHTDTTQPNPLPPNTYDLESRALHELGHAHLLNHSNNPSDLMYFTDLTPPYRRQIMPNDLAGGLYIMDISTAPIPVPSNCQNPMESLTIHNCGSATNTRNIKTSSFSYAKIFPNPAINNLTISFNDNHYYNKKLTVKIFDILGKEQAFYKISEKDTQIDLSELPNGMYIISLIDGGRVLQSHKLLKQ
ncbi:MAG: T9SS type A sorting domain-containing protein [Saprospiraceae bacterium]